MASSRCNILERREKASEEGNSSPYVPPEIQEGSSSLHLQNSRRKASLPSRRGGVYKSDLPTPLTLDICNIVMHLIYVSFN